MVYCCCSCRRRHNVMEKQREGSRSTPPCSVIHSCVVAFSRDILFIPRPAFRAYKSRVRTGVGILVSQSHQRNTSKHSCHACTTLMQHSYTSFSITICRPSSACTTSVTNFPRFLFCLLCCVVVFCSVLLISSLLSTTFLFKFFIFVRLFHFIVIVLSRQVDESTHKLASSFLMLVVFFCFVSLQLVSFHSIVVAAVVAWFRHLDESSLNLAFSFTNLFIFFFIS